MYQGGGSGLRGATFLPHYDRLGVSPSLDSDNFLINERWHHVSYSMGIQDGTGAEFKHTNAQIAVLLIEMTE